MTSAEKNRNYLILFWLSALFKNIFIEPVIVEIDQNLLVGNCNKSNRNQLLAFNDNTIKVEQ